MHATHATSSQREYARLPPGVLKGGRAVRAADSPPLVQPQTTTYAYDSFNRKVSERLPDHADGIVRETTWQYTVVNELRRKREPAGNEIVSNFDGFGQVTGTSITAVGSQLSRSMTYTRNGKLESVSESES